MKGNRHHHSATIYYLLLKKNLKKGINSNYDICSVNFERRFLQLPSKELHNETTIESLEVRNTTSSGYRNSAFGNRNLAQNNYLAKRKQESVELKLDVDNLPIVDNNLPIPKRRKL